MVKTERKAYYWHDEESEYNTIAYACTAGEARQMIAYEVGAPFIDIHVRRLPWADKYGDVKNIPLQAYLDNGWSLECADCGNYIYDDDDYLINGDKIYCCYCMQEEENEDED